MSTTTQKTKVSKNLRPPLPAQSRSSSGVSADRRSASVRPKADDWHKKIAASRGASWKKNMLAGRRDALLNPSNIRILRLRKDIHQEVIARNLDMSESTFGAIERGKRMVKKDVAEQIAKELGTSVTKIFKSTARKTANPRRKASEKFVAIIGRQEI